ncbi:MAG: peptide deformylase [Sandaracinaceae bacterium]
MAVLPIVEIGHPVLREVAREVGPDELERADTQRFIDDLIETMRHANGAGLAANQVGNPVRICALEVHDNPRYPYKPNIPLTVLVNPRLTPVGDATFQNYEGCLSVPNLRGVVTRHAELRLTAVDREGAPIEALVRGITAGTYQHECDHLDGTLFVDRVDDPHTFCTWDAFRTHQEAAFADRVRAIVERWGS